MLTFPNVTLAINWAMANAVGPIGVIVPRHCPKQKTATGQLHVYESCCGWGWCYTWPDC